MKLIGPPRLVEFSSQVCSRAPVSDPGNTTPSCLLQLKLQDSGSVRDDKEAPLSTVTVELSRSTLDTLLDGMGRIRDQLSTVAGRK